jgi:hypothetical protein
MKADVYERITSRIVAELEQGVRPWLKPWNAEHAMGRITRPLRSNGMAYQGINVLMLWGESVAKGYAAPMWMTFKQAEELGAHVRKGEHGSLVVYADRIRRTELDAATGEEAEREIPFLKGYTVFNVEQIEGLPAHYYVVAEPPGCQSVYALVKLGWVPKCFPRFSQPPPFTGIACSRCPANDPRKKVGQLVKVHVLQLGKRLTVKSAMDCHQE